MYYNLSSSENGRLNSPRGMSRLGMLLFILITVVGVWLVFHVMPFFYSYYELEGQMQAQANKASLLTDKQIREELMPHIRKLEIPIGDPDDLKINRFDGKIVIELKYTEVLFLDLGEDRVYDLYTFPFTAHVEREF